MSRSANQLSKETINLSTIVSPSTTAVFIYFQLHTNSITANDVSGERVSVFGREKVMKKAVLSLLCTLMNTAVHKHIALPDGFL